jgi:hypothetical protein
MPVCRRAERHPTHRLFAGFDLLEGAVLGRCTQRYLHRKFYKSAYLLNLI